MIITSYENATIKKFAKLQDKKYRDEYNRYIIEGYRAVKDSLPFLSECEILLSETAEKRFGQEFPNALACTDKVFESLSETENAQGVLCSAPRRKGERSGGKFVLFLDRIRDPGNMGTIIRTALATEFSDIFCLGCVDPYNPKVVRSATSAVARVNLINAAIEDLKNLQDDGYTLFSADAGGENIFESKISADKVCLIVGNEANGIENDIITMSDRVLCLPMKAGESLNASVAAAVLMYKIRFGG